MLTQLNTTVSEYLNQNRASLKRPAYPCTLTRSIQTGCVTCTSENPFSSICPAILPASSPTPALHFLSAPKLLCHWNKHQHSALLPPDRLNFLYSLYSAVPSSPLPPPPFPCSICPRLMPSLNISPATLPPSLKNKPKFSCNHASHCLSASWLISLGEWARTIVLCNTPNFGISPILAGSGNYAPG